MPDLEKPNERGLFGGVFGRGGVEVGDTAWLQAMLDTEAGLARALERAGLTPAGSGAAVTAAAQAKNFDPNELGGFAALTGNPGPGLAGALARLGAPAAAGGGPRGGPAPSPAAPPARTSWTRPRCCSPSGPSPSSTPPWPGWPGPPLAWPMRTGRRS